MWLAMRMNRNLHKLIIVDVLKEMKSFFQLELPSPPLRDTDEHRLELPTARFRFVVSSDGGGTTVLEDGRGSRDNKK